MGALDRLPKLGPRSRRIAVVAGLVLLGLVSFIMALQLTFPYERVKDKLVEKLASSYDMTVTRVERGFMPGRMTMHGVTLRSRVTSTDEVPELLYIDSLEVDVGFLGLISGVTEIGIDAKLGRGRVSGTLAFSKSGTRIDLVIKQVAADAIPQIRSAVSMPVFGSIDATIDLNLPRDFKETSGVLQLACTRGCAFGDGKTKFKPKLQSSKSTIMMGDGIEFGTVNIDHWLGRIELKDGKADLTKWEFVSADGELEIDAHLALGRSLKDSDMVRGCLKYRGSAELARREEKTSSALTIIGGLMDSNGLFNIKLDGKLSVLKKRPRLCVIDGDDSAGDDESGDGTDQPRTKVRPTLAQPGDDTDDTGALTPTDNVFSKEELIPTPTVPSEPVPAPSAADKLDEKAAQNEDEKGSGKGDEKNNEQNGENDKAVDGEPDSSVDSEGGARRGRRGGRGAFGGPNGDDGQLPPDESGQGEPPQGGDDGDIIVDPNEPGG